MKRTYVLGILFSVFAVGLMGCSSNMESYENTTNVNADSKQQSNKDISDKEAINFLQKAFQAQESLQEKAYEEKQKPDGTIDTINHPLTQEEIKKTLQPYQTEESITNFIQKAGDTTNKGWLPHTDQADGFLADYKFAKQITFKRANGQIEVTAHILVEEQSPATVIATLSKTDKGWRVSKIDIK